MNKKELTEADIRRSSSRLRSPARDGSKWNLMTQLREEVYFTRGRVIVRGKTVKRGDAKKIDYWRRSPCMALQSQFHPSLSNAGSWPKWIN